MQASTIYLNLIYRQASIGEYLEGMSILHINECKELLRSTHGSISILAATADAVIYLRFLLSEQNLLTGTYYLGYAVQSWLGNLHVSCHFFCNCRMNTSQSIHQSLYKQSYFQVNKGSSPCKAESQQVSILAMQWFVSNLYDLHIKIKPVLSLKRKAYSAGIHSEGEPAQGVRILCIRVTWLSVEATGCCSTSLLSVGLEKRIIKKKNLPHYAFPPRSKVSFHPLTQSWKSTRWCSTHTPSQKGATKAQAVELSEHRMVNRLYLYRLFQQEYLPIQADQSGRTCTAWNVPIWHDKKPNQTLKKWQGFTGVGGGKQGIPELCHCY